MRRRFIIALVAAAAFCTFVFCMPQGASAAAANDGDIQEELKDEVEKGLATLVSEELENFFKSMTEGLSYDFAASLKDYASGIIAGKYTLSAEGVVNLIGEAVRQNLFAILSYLATLIGLAALYGLCKRLNSGFLRESTSQIVYFAVYGAIVTTLTVIVGGAVKAVGTVLSSVTALMELFMPVMLTLIAALGGASSLTVFQPVTLVVSSIAIKIVDYAVMPLFLATIVFGMIGNLSSNLKLNKLTKTLRSVANWILSITFGGIGALISVQSIVGASIDNVTIKSAKFALSSYVPIIGGYISDGFDVVLAGGILIKNAFGLTGIVLLLAIILAPTIRILVTSVALRLVAGVIEPLADEKISSLMYTTGKSMTLLLSVLLGVFFLVFLILLLMVSACNSAV